MNVRGVARALLVVGTVGVVGAASKFHAAVVADPPYDFTESFRFAGAVSFVALLLLAAYALGLPDRHVGRRGAVAAGAAAPVVGAVGVSLIQLAMGEAFLPRFVVLGAVVLLAPWYVLCAFLSTDLDRRSGAADRVLVVGDLADVSAVMVDLQAAPERPATLVDVLTPQQVRATHRTRPLVERAEAAGATLLVLDATALADASVVRQAALLHERGVRVRSLLDFYEQWLGKLPVSELERSSMMFDIAELHRSWYAPVKRLEDVVLGTAMFVVLVVVAPLVWLGNRLGNPGPLLFRQERVGKGGRTFEIVKFRTMRPGGDGRWTAAGDDRVTPFGRFLRRTHLDELPQAWNILRGDLSVVGPRPEQVAYVAELEAKLPFYRLRHLVQPGLTGWAQVKYGYAASSEDALEKLQYEMYSLRHQGLRFDLLVLARTIRSVLGGPGAGR